MGVADVAVIGIPDVDAGELPKAFVVRLPGSNISAEEIKSYVAGTNTSRNRLKIIMLH